MLRGVGVVQRSVVFVVTGRGSLWHRPPLSRFALYFGYLAALHTQNNGAQSVTCSNAETHKLAPNDVSD